MAEERIGVVSTYFAKIGVVGIDLEATLSVGDTIQVKGHTTDFEQKIESLQIERNGVEEAGAGASVGTKVAERCRSGDVVYRVT
ncbi:MAG TPA: translation elongation factor-like protein [Dehalococcoidia bacterium]|jgi:putative protease|nr:translation elongation factor-like protein [Dehalococcoidia bacterium]